MTMTPTQFITRTGRIVWAGGDDKNNPIYTAKTKDFDGNPMTIKSGPDAGKPTQRYDIGVAIKKALVKDATTGQMRPEAGWHESAEGALICAQGFKDHPQSAQRPDFAWKVTDGDSTIPGKPKDGKPGRRPCDKEGHPGHWIFAFSSSYPFKFVNANGSAAILEPNAVKVGDYVQVAGNVVGNTGATPGVYLNHQFIALQGYGAAITNGPDPATLGFGQGPRPEGMSDVPVGGMKAAPAAAGAPAPASPLPSAPGTPSPGAPAPGAATPLPAAPAQNATPAPTGVVPNASILNGGAPGAPSAPAAAAPAAPPAGPTMTPKAAGVPWSDFVAKNWTEETARAHGYIV